MLPLAAYLGNTLMLMMMTSWQLGWFDDLFDDDDGESYGPTGEDGDVSDLYDAGLYPSVVQGSSGADDVTASGATPQAFFLGGGNDMLEGSANSEYAQGGSGDDVLIMREGDDLALGGSGEDQIFGGIGNDYLLGEDGDDVIEGSLGADRIEGGDGDDLLTGGREDDVIFGGAGNDTLTGDIFDDVGGVGRGVDSIHGGAGDDTLWLFGEDTGSGGSGADLFRVINADQGDTLVTITDYDAAEDMIEIVYADTADPAPALSVETIGSSDDVQILLDSVAVATITGGVGLTVDDVILTAGLT